MAKIKSQSSLNVWMNGQLVANWHVSSNNVHELRYYDEWLDSELSRPLSLSLPLIPSSQKHRGVVVESFFDNLLPGSSLIRKRIQARFGKKTDSSFNLLSEIGRDCVGVVQLLDPDIKEVNISKIESRKVSAKEISICLRNRWMI